MGQEIGGHERAVAVTADGHAVAIADAATHQFVHGGLGAGDELLDEGVVGLFVALADDGHGGIVEDGVTARQEEHGRPPADAGEAVGRVGDLAGGVLALEFGRVGPQERGQRAVAILVVAGRQVERAGERDAVGPLVGNHLLGDAGELRRGIGEEGLLDQFLVVDVAQVVVGRLGLRLAAGQDQALLHVQDLDRALVVRRLAAEQPLLGAGLDVPGVEERSVALVRGAGAAQVDGPAAVGRQDDLSTVLVADHDRLAGVAVTVLPRAFLDQTRINVAIARLDVPDAQVPRGPPPRRDEGQVLPTPHDAAIALGQRDQLLRLAVERCGQGVDLVAPLGLLSAVPAVERLGPDQFGGDIGAPGHRPRADPDRPEGDGNLVLQRQVGHQVRGPAGFQIPDLDTGREAAFLERIAVRMLQRADQEPASVGRRVHIAHDHGFPNVRDLAIQLDDS